MERTTPLIPLARGENEGPHSHRNVPQEVGITDPDPPTTNCPAKGIRLIPTPLSAPESDLWRRRFPWPGRRFRAKGLGTDLVGTGIRLGDKKNHAVRRAQKTGENRRHGSRPGRTLERLVFPFRAKRPPAPA